MNLKKIFKNKKVLITGHTGFKGSWLSLWLSLMGAKMYGISISVPTSPSHYDLLKLKLVKDIRMDIANSDDIRNIVNEISPDFLFHMAAQPLVSYSYKDPIYTFKTNTLGTANIMDALRYLNNRCVAILITSDKSYDNLEITRGYHEKDKLGGADPYSGSKGAAELIINSYIRSFFPKGGDIKVGVGRAGNVIGGGDWAENRIIPDVIRAISKKEKLIIRSPKATRPWQHVLEPLSGYLTLAADLYKSDKNHGEAFNFGPSFQSEYTVEQMILELKSNFENLNWGIDKKKKFKESNLLQLDCTKAFNKLNWESTLDFSENINFTSEWYNEYFNDKHMISKFSESQIIEFEKLSKTKKNHGLRIR